jgi:hypothetical protein
MKNTHSIRKDQISSNNNSRRFYKTKDRMPNKNSNHSLLSNQVSKHRLKDQGQAQICQQFLILVTKHQQRQLDLGKLRIIRSTRIFVQQVQLTRHTDLAVR